MMQCEECGQVSSADTRFCKHCGTALPEGEELTADRRPRAAEPAQPAADMPEIPSIAPITTDNDIEPDTPQPEVHDQARREALAELARTTEARLEEQRAEDLKPEPESFAQGDYSAQDYSRDYASQDEPEPPPPLLPPIEAAFREEAMLLTPATSASPDDAKEMDKDAKKLGAFCGWGCTIVFVIWIIVMIVILFVNRAG